MKQLELSAEKAVEREEKLKDKILHIQQKYKAAEGRYGSHCTRESSSPYLSSCILSIYVFIYVIYELHSSIICISIKMSNFYEFALMY